MVALMLYFMQCTFLLYSELTAAQRSLGRPKTRYKDSLKESLKRCDIPYSTWEAGAKDRPAWRSLVSKGVLMARYQCQNYVCLNVLNLYWH